MRVFGHGPLRVTALLGGVRSRAMKNPSVRSRSGQQLQAARPPAAAHGGSSLGQVVDLEVRVLLQEAFDLPLALLGREIVHTE